MAESDLERIMAKKAEKLQASRERIQENKAAAEDVTNHILVEMLPTGLYKCRFEKGTLPESLKGQFTTIRRVKDLIQNIYGNLDRMKVV